MPSRKKERNMRSKRNYYTSYTRKPKKKWVFQNNITSRQLKDIDEIIYKEAARERSRATCRLCMPQFANEKQQAKFIEGKETWKVVPKDSCEVYKDRRKRKLNAERKKEENKYDEVEKENKKDDSSRRVRRPYRRITRRGQRYKSRRRDTESSSSYSTWTCCSTCSGYMDYE